MKATREDVIALLNAIRDRFLKASDDGARVEVKYDADIESRPDADMAWLEHRRTGREVLTLHVIGKPEPWPSEERRAKERMLEE